MIASLNFVLAQELHIKYYISSWPLELLLVARQQGINSWYTMHLWFGFRSYTSSTISPLGPWSCSWLRDSSILYLSVLVILMFCLLLAICSFILTAIPCFCLKCCIYDVSIYLQCCICGVLVSIICNTACTM